MRRGFAALLAVACAGALPLPTHSHTFEQLLQLPIERLLQIEYGNAHHGH